jgi:hypothetical protein
MTGSLVKRRVPSKNPDASLRLARGMTDREGVDMSHRTCTVAGCNRMLVAWGLCGTHYARWKKTGDGSPIIPTVAERFWSHVNKGPNCWEWVGVCSRGGYGSFGFEKRMVGAHRVVWKLTYGSLSDLDHVLHHCDNPPCVRPDHLFLGDPLVNARDKIAKGRSNIHSGRGRKLTWDIVESIRSALNNGARPVDLAKEYGVSGAMITRIKGGMAWDPTKRAPAYDQTTSTEGS